MHRRHHMLDLFSWRSSFTKTYILRDLGFPKLQWLSAALQQTTNEGTLQPARRSNLQAVEKSVTTPNQTARSVFLYIYILLLFMPCQFFCLTMTHLSSSSFLSSFKPLPYLSLIYSTLVWYHTNSFSSRCSIYIVIYFFFSFLHSFDIRMIIDHYRPIR